MTDETSAPAAASADETPRTERGDPIVNETSLAGCVDFNALHEAEMAKHAKAAAPARAARER